MGEQTGISWSDHTWNPWYGCHKVSAGCDNCYMFRDAGWQGRDANKVVLASGATWQNPLKWDRAAREAGEKRFVFLCSWSDFWIEEADDWRAEAFEIMRQTPNLVYLILTKRPENIAARLPEDWGAGYPNVALGVSAEDQEMADLRIAVLLDTPARWRFVSVEPMLGAVEIAEVIQPARFCANPRHGQLCPEGILMREDGVVICRYCKEPVENYHAINWVICGGETGPNARPMHPDWVRSLRDQCFAAQVPFHFKSWGEWSPCDHFDGLHQPGPVRCMDGQPRGMMTRIGHKAAGRVLDGRVWDERPGVD